jgi:hypothetical protein
LALAFSGFSLWETSLKQAELTVYATGVVTYERDLTADDYIRPSGGFEVFAVPITKNSVTTRPLVRIHLSASEGERSHSEHHTGGMCQLLTHVARQALCGERLSV